MFFQVQLSIFCSIKTIFAGFLRLVDTKGKSINIEASFDYNYSVARPHFNGNQALDVYSTLSKCNKLYSVNFWPCSPES